MRSNHVIIKFMLLFKFSYVYLYVQYFPYLLTQGYSHLSGMETTSLLNRCLHSGSELRPY